MRKEASNSTKTERNYSELRQKYEELMKTQKLKDELIIMLVHDLKSPLTTLMENIKAGYKEIDSIQGLIPGSKNKSGSFDTKQLSSSLSSQKKYLTAASSDAQLLWRRVTNLLDIKKMEESQMHLELGEFSVNGLVDDAVSSINMLADFHNVKIEIKLLEEDIEVLSDFDLVERVLTNLLSNAIKHSSEENEGKGTVNLTLKDEGAFLRFDVQDSGLGVPESFRKRLFEKYTQLKRIKGSTGLGLTFSKLAVETLQGSINTENIKDRGALFFFAIPKQYNQEDTKKEPDELEQWEFN